mgnify:CR=1 FL=1
MQWSGLDYSVVECIGMEGNEIECNSGMEWNGVEWNGVE